MIVRFHRYEPDTLTIDLNKNILLPIELASANTQLVQVVVSARKRNENVTKPLMGIQKLTTSEIRDIPVLFGEKDVLKTIQLLPGIQFAGDGNSDFYGRGGCGDQNLILLDEPTAYNPSPLPDFFSPLNSDAIKDITVYTGCMPAEYVGRLSSVVDIRM